MNIILLFSASLLLIPLPQSDTPVNSSTKNDDPKMWTTADIVYRGEVLNLQFGAPHASRLGVIDPDGHFYYIIYPGDCAADGLKPFLSSEAFAWYTSVKINTTDFQADPYTYGVTQNQTVFTKTGTYRFLLGDNLHTDDEHSVTILNVQYYHTPRPQPEKKTAIARA
ncbi:MAG: hypothetical protein IT269_02210 [Saprospiraceae bacterium]|nr:hypothetical protein [Saprospiraceae bacterium]